MDLKVTAQRLCLLLSWQEALHRTPQNEAFSGRVYRRHAAKVIAELREEARQAITAAGGQLQALVARGEDGPEAAALRHQIQQINHLLKADSASDLGGPVAMTLEGYADAFGANRAGAFTPLERLDYIIIAGTAVIILTVCLGLAWFLLWRSDVSFSVEPSGDDHLALHIRNGGQYPVEFVGGWSPVALELGTATYGVTLHCQTEEDGEFQTADSIGGVWIYQREVMLPRRRISVEPGMEIAVLLDIRALEAAYGSRLTAVRIECGTSRRKRQAVFTESVIPQRVRGAA